MRATEWTVVTALLACFSPSKGFTPSYRGDFAPPRLTTNPNLVEGDMAVPESHLGTGLAPAAFIKARTHLWPRGVVYYRFETFEWEGVVEPVFSDSQLQNITQAHDHIMREVPCIKFMWVLAFQLTMRKLNIFRLVDANLRGPHLIYSVMGDDLNPAHACFSYVGRVGGSGANKGQIVNLGSAVCLAVGIILHETLHSLGLINPVWIWLHHF